MSLRHRSAIVAAGASCAAALAGLVIATTPVATVQRLGTAGTTQASAQAHAVIAPRPPLGRPAPSGATPDLRPADTAGTASSPWTPLANPPPFGTPGTMLLESDGTVLVHNEPDNNTTGGTNEWWKLTPAANGSYIDGTWSQIASMPASYSPLYFASAILPDGRMIVEGGEYIGENAVWSSQGEIYNPVTNTWRSVAPPPGWTNIGDAASEVLDNGTFMLQQSCNTCLTNPDPVVDQALLNARTLTWKVIPGTGKEEPNDEEGWTLMPSGQVLTLDVWEGIGGTQFFNPGSNTWSFAGDTALGGDPVDLWPVVEIGPQAGMPGGNVFVVGAGTSTQEPPTACTTDVPTQTALYDSQSATWTAGPQIPAIDGQEMDATDGPAATLPDGNVLFDVSACVYNAPTHFFLYNASSSTLTQIPDVPNAPNDTSYATRFLDLPNGQVLFDDGSNQMEVYTAGGTPNPSWAPSITSLSSTRLAPGSTYTLSGRQLAGLDQGAVYGDDVQESTNFPVVRITNSATGVVTYARTSDWTSVSVAAGTSSSTRFTLPPGTPAGKSTLVVVANGIASPPSTVTIS
ncbi:MAG TPA: kelch repeat-containing protein [Streptosporangiaceae bacterium]|nr:kelch repeat-containing protein [Streptosporangiaceae bacterium]